MVMTRWDPFREMRLMQENMNRLWRNFLPTGYQGEEESWAIPLDLVEDKDNIVIHASLPGVDPQNIQVSVEDNMLSIRAETSATYEHRDDNFLLRERRMGSFYRALRLPDTVDFDKAQTNFEHGVLTIILPKVESKKARQLKVNVGGTPETRES